MIGIKLPQQLDFLLIVRGLASVSVVYWHLYGYLEIQNYWASFLIIPGRLAVWIFFMMSGYLIGHGLIYGRYEKSIKGLVRFYFNRLLRIYPIFIVVSLISLLIADTSYSIDAAFLFREFMMVQWNHNYQLNGVFWTLGVEAQLYLIAPLLIYSTQLVFSRGLSWAVAMYLIVLFILWLYSKSDAFLSWDLRNVMGGITHFAIGIAGAAFKKQIALMGSSKYAFISALAIVLILIGYFNHNYSINMKMTLVSNLIGIGLIVMHVILEERKLMLNIFLKILLILGVLSYGTYAWHGVLTLNKVFMDQLFFHLIAATFLAYITYILIERPLLYFKK